MTNTWTRPRAASPAEKIKGLSGGLFWTFGVIQFLFVVLYGAIVLEGESEKTGEPFHDLGVAIATDHAVNDLTTIWIFTSVALGLAFAVGYRVLKDRWTR